MLLEYDPNKNAANIEKHGIDFSDLEPFFDGPLLEKPTGKPHHNETRISALGIFGGMTIYVVYTWRDKNRRIISARLASREERRLYREWKD